MKVLPITGDVIRSRLHRISADVAVEHLRRLPDVTLAALADLLNLVERTGTWPSSLAQGYISLIPKGEGMHPTNMRPLSVLSNIYRVWAGIRLENVMEWQEQWVHPYAYGFRSHKGTGDAYTLLMTMVELSSITGSEFHVIGLDYVKCFDRVPQGIVLAVASRLGLDLSVCRALGAMYETLQRAFKLNGCMGSFFHATNGILQGCPLSVALINMLTTVWKRVIDEVQLGVTIQLPETSLLPSLQHTDAQCSTYKIGAMGYADDTCMMDFQIAHMVEGLRATETFLQRTDQAVKPKKSLQP